MHEGRSYAVWFWLRDVWREREGCSVAREEVGGGGGGAVKEVGAGTAVGIAAYGLLDGHSNIAERIGPGLVGGSEKETFTVAVCEFERELLSVGPEDKVAIGRDDGGEGGGECVFERFVEVVGDIGTGKVNGCGGGVVELYPVAMLETRTLVDAGIGAYFVDNNGRVKVRVKVKVIL